MPRVAPVRKKSFHEAWDNELEKHGPAIVKAYFNAAKRGDSKILLDLGNRILGKPRESIELSGPGGAPIALQAAAPIALALMSSEELRALAGFQSRLGLPDVELIAGHATRSEQPNTAEEEPDDQTAEPGPTSPVPLLPSLPALPAPQPVSHQPNRPTSAGTEDTEHTTHNPEQPAPLPPEGDNEDIDGQDDAGPVRASHDPEAAPAAALEAQPGPGFIGPTTAEPIEAQVYVPKGEQP